MPPIRAFLPRARSSRWPLVFAVVFGTITLFGAALLSSIALGSSQVTYAIQDGELTVSSGIVLDGTRSFALSSVRDARTVDLIDPRRTRGTAAPGICTGQWWYQNLGPVWQATNCSRSVVVLDVAGQDRPILVSPPDHDAFIAAVRTPVNAFIALPAGDPMLLRVVPGAAAVLLVVTACMLIALFVAGPRRMRYVIEDGRLRVETIFSKRSWPAHALRARAHAPAVALRLMGTAFPGYYTGLFRADGKNTRIYATNLSSGVLIEGPARVFLSPADPRGFLAALRDAGSAVDG